jgi:cytochrome c oxidase subunit 2
VFFWAGIGVAAVVYGLIAWCIVRYRKRAGDTAFPRQFRRNNKMEIVYTALPILMVGGLFAVTYPAERHVEAIAAAPQLVVNVTAFRRSWRFDYPQTGTSIVGTPSAPPELVLPLNETVRLNVTSVDVDHSFWQPWTSRRDCGALVRHDAHGLSGVAALAHVLSATLAGRRK